VDNATCGRFNPCRTFAAAQIPVVPGGEIVVLDAGGYSPITITKSLSIIADGVMAGINPQTGNAITVAAGATDKVFIRGLYLEGKGTGARGINATGFGSLFIENVRINAFSGDVMSTGINIAPTTTGTHYVSIKDSEVRNSLNEGIGFSGGLGGPLTMVIDHTRIERNTFGISGANGTVTLRDSMISGNSNAGISTIGGISPVLTHINVVESTVSHNGTNGIETNSFGPASVNMRYRLTNSSLTNNGSCGVFVNAPAVVETVQNNLISGNTVGQVCGGVLTPTPLGER
jgi:hypothetical protein